MRIIALIITLFVTPAIAKMYKCEVNSKTSYQQFPCVGGGSEIEAYSAPTEAQRRSSVQRTNTFLYNKAQEEARKEARRQERIVQQREDERLYMQQELLLYHDEMLTKMDRQGKDLKQIKREASRTRWIQTPSGELVPIY